jgi:anaerobic ribonucleoside-triphosphate reductase activating protein
LIKEIKEKFHTKDIWLYTGFTLEQIFPTVVTDDFNLPRFYRQEIIRMCDVVVDGAYVDCLRDITLKWKGSSNQRVIDVQQSLKSRAIVLYNN